MIFITGSGRCGTTLLRSLLDGHSGLNVYPKEVSSVLELFIQASGYASQLRTEELLQENKRSQIHRLLQTLALPDGDRDSHCKIFNPEQRPTVTIHQLLCEVQRHFFPGSKKQTVFDATSPYISGYLKIGDDVRVIHMLRHPYNTMNSFFRERYADPNHTGGAHPGEWSFANGFERIEESFYQANKLKNHPRVLLVKLEELQSNPEYEMRRVLSFLGLELEEGSLTQTKSGHIFYGNSSNKNSEKIFRQPDDWSCLTRNDLFYISQIMHKSTFYTAKNYEFHKNSFFEFFIRHFGISGNKRKKISLKSVFSGRIFLIFLYAFSFFFQDQMVKSRFKKGRIISDS